MTDDRPPRDKDPAPPDGEGGRGVRPRPAALQLESDLAALPRDPWDMGDNRTQRYGPAPGPSTSRPPIARGATPWDNLAEPGEGSSRKANPFDDTPTNRTELYAAPPPPVGPEPAAGRDPWASVGNRTDLFAVGPDRGPPLTAPPEALRPDEETLDETAEFAPEMPTTFPFLQEGSGPVAPPTSASSSPEGTDPWTNGGDTLIYGVDEEEAAPGEWRMAPPVGVPAEANRPPPARPRAPDSFSLAPPTGVDEDG